MPVLDEKVAHVLDRQQNGTAESDDEDALIAELEDDEDDHALSVLREQRLEQLHAEMNRAKVLKETQHGTYQEIKDEKELMDITTSTKLCVVHFKKDDFNRCRIMDQKLAPLAEKHYEVRFVSIDVENAPFLVVKLGIQVLPCVICFKDGVSVDRIIGFEGIGYRPDSFTAKELEARLLRSGILERAKMVDEDGARKTVKQADDDADDDDDWD